MASIQRRPDGRWRARYRDAAGKEHAQHFTRKVDAQRFLDGITTAVVSGTYCHPKAGRIALDEYAATWLARQTHLRPSTGATYGTLLRVHVLSTFGGVPLAKVERSAVASWVADLTGSGLAASTVRQCYRVLSLILGSAVADGLIARNVAAGVRAPRARSASKRFLDHRQVAALVDAAGDDGLAVRVLAYCGLRFGELAALRVGRVDLLRRRIEVAESATEVSGVVVFGEPKSHQCRSVPVPRSLVDALAVQCAGKGPDDLVFTAPAGGVLRLRNWRRRTLAPAATTAGLDGLAVHELRHTAASLAVSAGANVKAVQRMLGHASAAMTLDVYSGLFDDDLDAVAERMDAAASSAVGPAADYLRTVEAIVTLPSRAS